MDNQNKTLSVNIPEKATKQLAFGRYGDGDRKLVVSTNMLRLFDFNPEDRVVERSLGLGKGMVVERVYDLFDAPIKTKKVYERSYKKRKNNPLESQLDIRSQKLLDESFPRDCKRVHIAFTKGRVLITPINDHQAAAINNAKTAGDRLNAFVACSSGVDASLLEGDYTLSGLVEYRPHEARDKKSDLTETGMFNALVNTRVERAYNEDIMALDVNKLAIDLANSPTSLFHASLQCDEFSNVKAKSLKDKSVEDLSTSIDMIYDALRIVDAIKPATCLFENVEGWVKSQAYQILASRLRRWGYTEHKVVADARDYGGLTSRKRAYCFFTSLPEQFSFEEKLSRRTNPIWSIINRHLPNCRNVSHSKSLQDGLECGRLRVIDKDKTFSPTILKSQERMAKDSVCIESDGELYWPSEALIKELMGIEESFCLEGVSQSIGSEIVGQSIDVPFHKSVMRSVTAHIKNFVEASNLSSTMTCAA